MSSAYDAQWSAAAQQAAAQLHIPASWILAQWAVEYGGSNGAGQGSNNPADLRALPGQSASGSGFANFSSLPAFVAEYVTTMRRDFSYFANPVASPTPAQVFGSQHNYTTSQSAVSYTQAVLSQIAAMGGSGTLYGPGAGASASLPAPGTGVSTLQGVIDNGQVATQTRTAKQDLTAGAAAAAASAGGGLKGIIAGIEAWLAGAGTIALGLTIAVVGLALLAFSERGTIESDLAGVRPQ